MTFGGVFFGFAEVLYVLLRNIGDGVAISLAGGLTLEQVLAECRAERIAVGASRVRYRALEDILVEAQAADP